MAAALIETIRQGQASLQDQLLVELGVRRGLVTPAQVADATATAGPGAIALTLVNDGALAPSQLDTLAASVKDTALLDTLHDSNLPDAVQAVSGEVERQLGRYVLVDEVGAGGMGVVWRGWDKQLQRWVAIKQLKVQDSRLIARFMREATLLAQLAHPNITDVFEVGVHDGRPFLVMELINGGSPESERLERADAAAVVRDAARAVHYAHVRDIIHRDLKPSNLLIEDDGRVFVTDFGLARMREEENGMTASGAILGTPSFMAPEQAQGRDADHRTDIYGLGATLYALVEGKPPYTGEVVHEVVKRVAVSNPPSLAGTDDLVVIAQKAMERDREDRYQSAEELADELDRYIRDEPILARPLNPLQRTMRRASRRPVLATMILVAALTTTVAVGWGASQLNSYYLRVAQIEDAQLPLKQAQETSAELRRLFARQEPVPEWETQAMANMGEQVERALAAAPGYVEAEFLAGELAIWQERWPDALAAFERALIDEPLHHQSRVYRVVARYAANDRTSPEIEHDGDGFRVAPPAPGPDLDALLALLRTDLEQIPEDYPRRNLAQAVYQSSLGHFGAAGDALEAHLKDHSYDQKVRAQMLWTLLAVGDYEQAIATATQMLARGGFPVTAHEVIAFAQAGQGDLAAAIEAMDQAQSLDRSLDRAQWIAFWRFRQEDFEAAFRSYQAILKEDPAHLQALLGRSTALGQLAAGPDDPLFEQALKDARSAQALAPDDAAVQFVLGGALLYQDAQAAEVAYQRAIELDPDYYEADANALIAGARIGRQDYSGAREALTKALEIRPQQASWRRLLVRVHLLEGDLDTALNLAQAAPEDSQMRLLAATALTLAGRDEAALAEVRAASLLAPDSVEVLSELGYFAAVTGQQDEARQAFSRADQVGARSAAQRSREVAGWYFGGALPAAQRAVDQLVADGLASAADLAMRVSILGALGDCPGASAQLQQLPDALRTSELQEEVGAYCPTPPR